MFTCLILGQFDFISSRWSVALFLSLYAVQAGCLLWVWKRQAVPSRRFVLVTALLFRLALLPAGLRAGSSAADALDPQSWQRFLLFDHDVWRFLWDPHVSAQGISPYAFAPSDAALDGLAQDEPWVTVRSYVNYPQTATSYPPGAQLLFRMSHLLLPGNPLGVKVLAIAADLVISALLPLPCVLLYAWNPLVLKAGAASGHFDSVLGLLLLATYFNLHRPWRAGALLGAAVLLKLSPLVLIPWLYRQAGLRSVILALGVTICGLAPFYPEFLQGLGAFASRWQFNAGYFAALNALVPGAARLLSGLTVLGLALWIAWAKTLDAAQQAAWTLFLLVVLSPAVMPWYLLWCLPLAVLAGEMIPVYFSMAVGLSIQVMIDGVEHGWWLWLEHAPLLAAIFFRLSVTLSRSAAIGRYGNDTTLPNSSGTR